MASEHDGDMSDRPWVVARTDTGEIVAAASGGTQPHAEDDRCPVHKIGGWIIGPRKAGCTCARWPLSEERPANRWAAFTDAELEALAARLDQEYWPTSDETEAGLEIEVKAELDRRRA